jgi:hypothetical protein
MVHYSLSARIFLLPAEKLGFCHKIFSSNIKRKTLPNSDYTRKIAGQYAKRLRPIQNAKKEKTLR